MTRDEAYTRCVELSSDLVRTYAAMHQARVAARHALHEYEAAATGMLDVVQVMAREGDAISDRITVDDQASAFRDACELEGIDPTAEWLTDFHAGFARLKQDESVTDDDMKWLADASHS